jgi:glycosyltransferase involved in cell wall biosynthesis
MACRCPVVSTRVGGPLDTVIEGKNGFLAEIDDSEALAAAVVNVLRLPEQDWKEMSDAALATATSYTWYDAGGRFEEVLRGTV